MVSMVLHLHTLQLCYIKTAWIVLQFDHCAAADFPWLTCHFPYNSGVTICLQAVDHFDHIANMEYFPLPFHFSTSFQLWVALKFSIAHLLPVARTAHLVRSAGPSRRLGMAARASIIPQSGQMSVALSLRERAGGSV